MLNKIIFSERLKLLRETKNLSKAGLGSMIGVSKVSVHYLETGVNYPHCNTLLSLADYFDVSLDYLTGRTDNPDSHKL